MEVFKVMLTGGYAGTHIELRKWDGVTKVSAIKTLRIWTLCGLKEAKEAVEAAGNNIRTSFPLVKRYDDNKEEIELPHEQLLKEMFDVGLTVELV